MLSGEVGIRLSYLLRVSLPSSVLSCTHATTASPYWKCRTLTMGARVHVVGRSTFLSQGLKRIRHAAKPSHVRHVEVARYIAMLPSGPLIATDYFDRLCRISKTLLLRRPTRTFTLVRSWAIQVRHRKWSPPPRERMGRSLQRLPTFRNARQQCSPFPCLRHTPAAALLKVYITKIYVYLPSRRMVKLLKRQNLYTSSSLSPAVRLMPIPRPDIFTTGAGASGYPQRQSLSLRVSSQGMLQP